MVCVDYLETGTTARATKSIMGRNAISRTMNVTRFTAVVAVFAPRKVAGFQNAYVFQNGKVCKTYFITII